MEKLKREKEKRPSGIPGVESFSVLQIGEDLVVREDNKWNFGALEPVSPLFQC